MLTRIVHPSEALQAFLGPLVGYLSLPQQQHVLQMADALLVCEDRKTLAALQRQFLEATDPSNWADFLRVSPWSAAWSGIPSVAIIWRGCWPRPNAAACPKSFSSTSMIRWARKTSKPIAWNRSIGSTITTNPPQDGPATTKPFAIWNVPRGLANSRPLSTCASICVQDRARLNRHRPADQRLRFRSKNQLGPRHPRNAEAAPARGLDRLRPV